MNCEECGVSVDMTGNPPSSMVWCNVCCRDAWFSARPQEAAKWTDVKDLTMAQRAELGALLGEGGKA